MTDTPRKPDRLTLTGDFSISRVLTGLWQVADIEKEGSIIDPEQGAGWLSDYVAMGFDTFDMADHYGSAEIIAGRMLARGHSPKPVVMTKWCPPPGPMTPDVVRRGVEERLERLGTSRVDHLQFHWWTFEYPGWLEALHEMARLREEGLIGELGVTNFDAAHFRLALADGVPLRTNQVSFSLVDRRAANDLADTAEEFGAWILGYGTLCGGFLSDRWLGRPDPADSITDWSKMKYHRFLQIAGGWEAFQGILRAAAAVAAKHGVSLSNVATRWVLEQRRLAGVIVGARLGEASHAADNLHLFRFALDDDDRALLAQAFAGTKPIPGDCGDEYRRPPFLTASGDLSHHLSQIPRAFEPVASSVRPDGVQVLTGSEWEEIAGYCRAHRLGDRILVSGTTATAGQSRVVAPQDAGAQTTYVMDRIVAAVTSLGGRAEDIVRTRIFVTEDADVAAVARAHGRYMAEVKPANTLVRVAGLVGEGYRVEIEAEALVAPAP